MGFRLDNFRAQPLVDPPAYGDRWSGRPDEPGQFDEATADVAVPFRAPDRVFDVPELLVDRAQLGRRRIEHLRAQNRLVAGRAQGLQLGCQRSTLFPLGRQDVGNGLPRSDSGAYVSQTKWSLKRGSSLTLLEQELGRRSGSAIVAGVQ